MRSLIVLLSILFQVTILKAQDGNTTVKKIDAIVKNIENAKGTSVKILRDKEVDENAESGITLTGYSRNDSIIKIQFYVAMFEGVWECYYYYDKGSLVLAREMNKAYLVDSVRSEIDFNHTTVKTDNRFYFSGDKLIKKTTNGKPMKSAMPDEQVTAGIHKYCDEYYAKLTRAEEIKAD